MFAPGRMFRVGLSATAPPAVTPEAQDANLHEFDADFSSEGIKLLLELQRVGVGDSSHHVGVRDNGLGIASNVFDRIFERFFQADPSHSRGTGTSGLGLSIVQALAAAQGGRAGAENGPNGGARLWFELPSAPGGATPTA